MSCWPRSHLSTRKGPLPIGRPVLGFVDAVGPDPREVLAGERMPRQDEAEQASPAREARLQVDAHCLRVEGPDASYVLRINVESGRECSWIARYVKTKSRAVTGTPSLQRASGRIVYVSVNGGVLVNVDRRDERRSPREVGGEAKAGGRTFSSIQKTAGRARTSLSGLRHVGSRRARRRPCRRASASARERPLPEPRRGRRVPPRLLPSVPLLLSSSRPAAAQPSSVSVSVGAARTVTHTPPSPAATRCGSFPSPSSPARRPTPGRSASASGRGSRRPKRCLPRR